MTLFQATERKLPEKAIEKTIEQAEPKELQPWSAAEGLRLCRAMKRYRVSRDEAILTEVQEYFDGWIAAGLPPVRVESTLPMLALVLLWEENHEPGYAPVIRTWVEGLLALPRSPEGALLTEENTVSAATVSQALLFLFRAGIALEKEAWRNEAKFQLMLHLALLRSRHTGNWDEAYRPQEGRWLPPKEEEQEALLSALRELREWLIDSDPMGRLLRALISCTADSAPSAPPPQP